MVKSVRRGVFFAFLCLVVCLSAAEAAIKTYQFDVSIIILLDHMLFIIWNRSIKFVRQLAG